MTISSTVRTVSFIGNGSASTFAFTFKVFQASDLLVSSLNATTGLISTLALTTDYSVALNADQDTSPGGSITLTAGALATGFTLTITSDIPNLQPTQFLNQGAFYPDVLTASLDLITILIQQLQVAVAAVNAVPPTVHVVLGPSNGAVDGVGATGNRTFTLPSTPTRPWAAQLFLNKALQSSGIDYTFGVNNFTYATALPPQIGDIHEIFYS